MILDRLGLRNYTDFGVGSGSACHFINRLGLSAADIFFTPPLHPAAVFSGPTNLG